MRKTLFSALMLCLLTIPIVHAQAHQDSDTATLRTFEAELMNAYKDRQVSHLADLLDDDFVITFEDGDTYGKLGYISYSASPSVKIELVEMSDIKIRIHGNTAILTGAYHERGSDNGAPFDYRDRFTDVWMKKGGKWKIISSHYAVPVGK
jgi:ketosteroid isomerase-like protein